MDNSANSKRIAKNTLILYVRMLFLMIVSLYTSRVILQALGVEDFGVYNVVGGFVALFAVLSKSLSSAASRFLNYEMGTGNFNKLSKVFSSTLTIHIFLAVVIALLAEIIGVWFVNNKMVIAPERLYAANWVFQFSVLTFCFNLITVPYHAAIIAHERMSVFAYISIFEGVGKLLICYLVMISPIDRLIFFAFLIFLMQFIVRVINRWYCKRNFPECIFQFSFDKPLLKEIFGFAGWNMIGSSAGLIRNQGGNVLINLFFGPVVNAARAIANQVLHAVQGFVESFFVAIRPQITQSYASGDWKYMMTLIYQGSRFSYYLLLTLSLPIFMNTDYLLHLWLTKVPDHSVLFVRLTIVFTMLESLSRTLVTAQLATGKIRNYQIVVGGLQLLNVPISYIFLKFGGGPETILFVAIFISVCCLAARLYMLRDMIPIKVSDYLSKVVLKVIFVSFVAAIIPCAIMLYTKATLLSFFLISLLCVLTSGLSILYIGCNKVERQLVFSKTRTMVRKVFK